MSTRLLPGENSSRMRPHRSIEEVHEPASPSVKAMARRFESHPTIPGGQTSRTTDSNNNNKTSRRRLSKSKKQNVPYTQKSKYQQLEKVKINNVHVNELRRHPSKQKRTSSSSGGKSQKSIVVPNITTTTTPAQKELAQFIGARMTPSRRSSSNRSEHSTKDFSTLVQRWQNGGSGATTIAVSSATPRRQKSREPFQPKIDQQEGSNTDGSSHKDSTPDTFCDFPVDPVRPVGPKTDPGQLESYAKLYGDRGNELGNEQVMSDQTIADMVKNSPLRPAAVRAAEAANLIAGEKDDEHMKELFKEAEETAEKAVMCDENEEYYEAFELYYVVVQLYWKVIPFMSPQEGEDIRSRIKMYIKRCDAIQEAFEDEGADLSDGEDDDDEKFESPRLQPQPAVSIKQVQQQQQQQQQLPSKQIVQQSSFTQQIEVSHSQPTQPAPGRTLPPTDTSKPVTLELLKPKADRQTGHAAAEAVSHPQNQTQMAIPSASTQVTAPPRQLYNSLQRPISRRAVRASTNSMSREKVAEMQERVQVMQDCLNNFTVKRKHLGPARALELQVTTLNANTFGDLKRLAPLEPKLEHRWVTELGVLLSVLQEIKEPRTAGGRKRRGGLTLGNADGKNLRNDIRKHLPNLESCDRRVQRTLRTFAALDGYVEYVDRETAGNKNQSKGRSRRRWWVKVPKIKPGGLPSPVRQVVDEAEREMKGVFKVCHEINVEVVKSMPVPASFVNSLPRHTKHLIGRELKEGLTTWDMFKITDFMKDRKMWNREAAKETASALEKVALLWESKTNNMNWVSRTLDFRGERVQQLVTAYRRCQTALKDLRREWPTMTHTALDCAKIESNSDVGRAGLEAYSRALESRAARLLSRIRELIDADNDARKR